MAEKMRIQSAGGIDNYLKTTPAQHARFTNAITNSVEVFGAGGFDKGMMRFFKFMADFLDRHVEDIRNMGKAFEGLEHAFEALVKSGEMVLGILKQLNPHLQPILILMLPLIKILGKANLLIIGLGLALEDITGYFEGKDSLTSDILQWFKGLGDVSWDGIASGIKLVGVAMAAAFLPIRTLALGISALIIAYEYLQNLDKVGGVDKNKPSLPSWEQMNSQNAKSGLVGKFESLTGGYEGGGWNLDKTKAESILRGGVRGKEYQPALQKIQNAFKSGQIDKDQFDRAMTAAGAGYSSADSLSKWIDSTVARSQNPNIFPSSNTPQIIELNLNGRFDNDMVKVMLDGANAHFVDKESQPRQQGVTK